ncbi:MULTISPECIES: helix-turn-helix domain-containing protein [Paenibacillus]|uniref:Helix-turn-helix domain-containing protein n=1 Tax=Paenibacillus violae TaxID=3077234 RepID=A0ABU3RP27_9BACL|nr:MULTISPECIES: helix-turn-helix domain-containing protein [Paenibacillus]MDU0205846.1 helix-turn-helix domain-containing protein [Paenibacillus sp. PFR10]MEC0269673.1 helix-turn-helix domain-containing protein [Paenibacillus anseongense]
MEKERIGDHEKARVLEDLLQKAQGGDKGSIEIILQYFEEEIIYLAKFIKMPKEDAIQTLKLELIEYIFQKGKQKMGKTQEKEDE